MSHDWRSGCWVCGSCEIVATESNREDDEGGLEVLGELIGRVNASTRGQESCDEAVAGPKIIRSLNSEGVKGIVNSSSSGSGQRIGKGDSFLLGLPTYGSNGSFSIWVRQKTASGAAGKPETGNRKFLVGWEKWYCGEVARNLGQFPIFFTSWAAYVWKQRLFLPLGRPENRSWRSRETGNRKLEIFLAGLEKWDGKAGIFGSNIQLDSVGLLGAGEAKA
ncbi:hypothetical protein COP2_037570 [Malus domestica]